MTSESSASWGVRTICLPFLGVGTTASGKQALLPCLWGVTGRELAVSFTAQHSLEELFSVLSGKPTKQDPT